MARKLPGPVAAYDANNVECTWVTRTANGIIESDSYNSCVGLVLHEDKHNIGAVAHFSGSMRPHAARMDTEEILAEICPIGPGVFKAWVFGGISIKRGSAVAEIRQRQTKNIIDAVKGALRDCHFFDINRDPVVRGRNNVLPPANYRDLEMNLQNGGYCSHQGVKLNVANGIITWIEPLPARVGKNNNNPKIVKKKHSF